MRRRGVVVGGLATAVLPRITLAQGAMQALDAALQAAAEVQALRAVVVARGGAVVAERYYGAAEPSQLQAIHSCTKSVVSLLVGQALAQDKLRGLDQTVAELLPDAVASVPTSPAAALTLRHILTGTTGLGYDFMRQVQALATSADPVRFALQLPREAEPGSRWSYNDAAIGLLSPILERAHGMPLQDVARRELAAPLGIEDLGWRHDASGRPTAYGGIRLKPRDLVKLAALAVSGGEWAGRQVVPRAWMQQSTQAAVPSTWPLPPVQGVGYGHLWFTGMLRGRPVAWAWGYGAQFAFAVPSLDLAIATAATSPPPQALPQQNSQVAAVVAKVVDAIAA